MNTERLYAIANAILDDLKHTDAVRKITELRDALKQQISQPSQPQNQQNVSSALERLYPALGEAPSNDFSPAWRQLLADLGVDGLLGEQLNERLQEIFSRNQITPATAHSEVDELLKHVSSLQDNLRKLIETFKILKLDHDDLAPGDCEVGVLIPRRAVENELGIFGKELTEIDRAFAPFDELVTGSRSGFDIRSISSSELTVLLAASPAVAACIAKAVEKLLTIYKQVLEIRTLRKGLAEQKVPVDKLTDLDKHINSHMDVEIRNIAGEVVTS